MTPADMTAADRVPGGQGDRAAARLTRVLRAARGLSWVVVAGMALALSWWSLFQLAVGFGVPVMLAAGVSLVFDAAALVCAGLAHRYALSPDSGAGPRFTMLALLAGSVYLNWTHAELTGYGTPAAVMFAAPAAVAVILFELETGWVNRTGRRDRGRVAPALPVLGRWSWLFHPIRSLRTLWLVTAAQADAVRAVELVRWRRVAREAGHLDHPSLTTATVPVDLTLQTRHPAPPTPPPRRPAEQPDQVSDHDDRARPFEPTRSPVITTEHTDPAIERDDQVTEHRDQVTEPDDRAAVEVTGQLGGLDDSTTRSLLAGMRTDAERVRFAARAVGDDAQAVAAFLTGHGQVVKFETIRTALRRLRQADQDAAAVLPIRRTTA